MIITPTDKIEVEIIPKAIRMPIYCLGQNGYVPLAFFTELGVSEEDIQAIIGSDDLGNPKYCEIQINRQQSEPAIDRDLIGLLISQLGVLPQYPVFSSICKKLTLMSYESGAMTIDDFADDFRQDSLFWQSKIASLPTQIAKSQPVSIPPHPQVDFATISRLEGKELADYLKAYPAFTSYMVTQYLCCSYPPLVYKIWKDYFFQCLCFHNRELEFDYFLYHLLIQDENVCLLTQTLFIDWMLETGLPPNSSFNS